MASETRRVGDTALAVRVLGEEALALLARLGRVKPFALHETMVPAASVSVVAQAAIEQTLATGRRELRARIFAYLAWLRGPGRASPPAEAQRRFALLRLRFNIVVAQFDLFAIVMTQRSEHETGVWLAGLDTVAADALALPGEPFALPPVICYLDRGLGAAIRRAKTRLPGGASNPVAIVRLPRERMIGSGVASSLVHEVGHQGAALLDLVGPLRLTLGAVARGSGSAAPAWRLWERWISEIVADFWSVGRIGVASTLGLMGVVSLPRAFVFRGAASDPHPVPWIRVKLSCAMGQALYPDPQWARLSALWSSLYPTDHLGGETRQLLALLEQTLPAFVALLTQHRPRRLGGRSLADVMPVVALRPDRLRACFRAWRRRLDRLRDVAPTFAFAVIGQARADGAIGAAEESRLLAGLLTHWALRATIDTAEACASRPAGPRPGAPRAARSPDPTRSGPRALSVA
jgi:hypothetical protein